MGKQAVKQNLTSENRLKQTKMGKQAVKQN